jgi:Sec-independent protein secretion pathway component TatC
VDQQCLKIQLLWQLLEQIEMVEKKGRDYLLVGLVVGAAVDFVVLVLYCLSVALLYEISLTYSYCLTKPHLQEQAEKGQ